MMSFRPAPASRDISPKWNAAMRFSVAAGLDE
jgi:hypothetical protein